jgi:hypothetical protein
MKEEEVMEIVQGLYKVAFDPEFIMRKVIAIRSFKDLKFIYRGAQNILGHIRDFNPSQVTSD